MPANIYKTQKDCFIAIEKILKKATKEEGILKNRLMKEILLNFPVSIKVIETFIKKFCLETGEYRMENGIIYPNE